MATSFLSRQDVERWLPESTPSNHPGFVARLYVTTREAFVSLAGLFSQTHVDDGHKRCQNELERFFLWGQGLSVVDGHLDDILAHSEELHFRVLSLLLRLGTIILHRLSREQSSRSKLLSDQCDDLRTILETTEAKIQESESELIMADKLSVSDTSEYGMEDILEDVVTYVDCLLDLAPSLDNPALDMPVENLAQLSTKNRETFAVSTEEAAIYCRKIRDRFVSLPKYIVERLAEANVIRAADRRSARSLNDLSTTVADAKSLPSESLFSTIDRGVTDTTKSTKSTAPSSSVFSSLLKRATRKFAGISQFPDNASKATFASRKPAGMSQFPDNASKATFASFSTSQSTISQGRVRVPPIPEFEGDSFACPICYRRVCGVVSRKAWKKHVFEDLKPYVCTIDKCEEPRTLYTHSAMWAEHESSHVVSNTVDCPFCGANFQKRAFTYFKHVSTHLQEVSLSVLPHPADEDDDFDSEDSNSEGNYSISDLKMREDKQHDSSFGQKEFLSQSKEVQILSEPAAFAGPSDHGHSQTPPASTQATVKSTNEAELNNIIGRLLDVRGKRPGKLVQLLDREIQFLCSKAKEVFVSQPMLLELEVPLKFCGGIHGQYYDLLRIFECAGFPPEANYLFMGNYVSQGRQSIETICLLLAYKIKYPENFHLLRGGHESGLNTRIFGFYDECTRRYNVRIWKTFIDCFNYLPIASIIDKKIFAANGGLSPDLNSMEQIRRIKRPTEIPDNIGGLMYDLLHGPGKGISGWAGIDDDNTVKGKSNDLGFTFGEDVVFRFLAKHDMDLIIRSNQIVADGYKFFARRGLVTICSVPNYRGEYGNFGAIMSVDESLVCSFQRGKSKAIKPTEQRPKQFGKQKKGGKQTQTQITTPGS